MDDKTRKEMIRRKHLQFSNSINPIAFIDYKKSDYMELYKGKVSYDLHESWDWIQSQNKGKKKSARKTS